MRIALGLLVGVLACSTHGARSPVVQRTSATHTPAAHTATVASSRVAWYPRLSTFPRAQAEPFRSQHFDGARLAEVRVNPEAEARYRTLVVESRFDEGTLLVETLMGQNGEASVLLSLERRGDGWHFSELDAEGVPLSVDHPSCRACHAGALAAPVFGPARPVPTRESKH